MTPAWTDGRHWSVSRSPGGGRGLCVEADSRKGVFLLAISGSQHNSLHKPRVLAAAANDSLILSPSPCRVCSKRRVVAVTTDTQTANRVVHLEAGMACSGVNYT